MGATGPEIGGRYRLEELLGRGGMSEVWRARDLELDRTVALKLLAPTADDERFRREARAVASLAHENVTQLYDYGEEHGRPYMVFEYLAGGTLDDRLRRRGRLPIAEAESIAAGIAAGLAHAHARGVVHRDLKAANVLFDAEGRPKIADFGIARLASSGSTLTEGGTVLGTAAYISPEQAAGQPAGPPSDVYSFGVLLYRMLAGRLPFESDDPLMLVTLHRDAEPPPVESLREDVPPALAALTAAALAKEPALRPLDGSELVAALGGVPEAAGQPTAVLPTVAADAPSAGRRRRAAVALTGLGALLVAGGALAWAVTRPPAGPTPAGTTSPFASATLPKAGGTSTSGALGTRATRTTTHRARTTAPAATQAATRRSTTAPAPSTTKPAPPPPPPTTAPPPPTTAATTVTTPATTTSETTIGLTTPIPVTP